MLLVTMNILHCLRALHGWRSCARVFVSHTRQDHGHVFMYCKSDVKRVTMSADGDMLMHK